jgi:hypothetical protein
MSKNINVNPGQYKVRGRERQGEDIVPEVEKAKIAKTQQPSAPKPKPSKKR